MRCLIAIGQVRKKVSITLAKKVPRGAAYHQAAQKNNYLLRVSCLKKSSDPCSGKWTSDNKGEKLTDS